MRTAGVTPRAMLPAREPEPYYDGLTRLQARLWHALVQANGRLVQWPELAQAVYGIEADVWTMQALRSHVVRMRRVLGPGAIVTVQGYGYAMGEV